MYIMYVFRLCEQSVMSLKTSLTQTADTTAFVDATAGMMFLTTPMVFM